MKTVYLFLIGALLSVSCASSQNFAGQQAAAEKVKKVSQLIGLTNEQEKKMLDIETAYLKNTKSLKYSPSYNAQLKALSDKRRKEITELLSREQLLKFDLIERNTIKLGPIRAN